MVMERSRRSRRRPRLHLSETSSQYGGRKKERSPSPPPEMLLPYLKWGAKRGDEEVGGLAVAPGGALMPEGGAKEREGHPRAGQSCSRRGCSALTKGEGDDGVCLALRGPPRVRSALTKGEGDDGGV